MEFTMKVTDHPEEHRMEVDFTGDIVNTNIGVGYCTSNEKGRALALVLENALAHIVRSYPMVVRYMQLPFSVKPVPSDFPAFDEAVELLKERNRRMMRVAEKEMSFPLSGSPFPISGMKVNQSYNPEEGTGEASLTLSFRKNNHGDVDVHVLN